MDDHVGREPMHGTDGSAVVAVLGVVVVLQSDRVPCFSSSDNVGGMNDPDRPSERLVKQRLRNRAMEALVALSEGDGGVRSVGVGEYVNLFFDVIDDDIPWHWREWSCFTPEEVNALDRVQQLLLTACAATPQISTDDEFIASGWPTKLQPVAAYALELMHRRGRFREDVEEENPSGT
jgi:hypothetical protein